MRRGTRIKIAKGIYRDESGIAAVVNVSPLPTKEKRFPPDTPLKTIKNWQDDTRVSLRLIAPTYRRGTFDRDVQDYLARVKPTHIDHRAYRTKERDIKAWLKKFGQRARLTLTTNEISAQMWEWRKTKSAKTCNHRRTALGHLFVVLDGKGAKNPVRDAVKFDPPDPKPKKMDLGLIDRILEAVTDDSKTQLRLRLMRWTGMRPSQIARLTRASFHLSERVPHVTAPRGKKGRVVRLPFIDPEALKTAPSFVTKCLPADGSVHGSWSTPSANRSLALACNLLDVPPFNLYRIKHSVGSRLREVMDLADIQKVYGHMDSETTEIYAPPLDDKIVEGFRHLSIAR